MRVLKELYLAFMWTMITALLLLSNLFRMTTSHSPKKCLNMMQDLNGAHTHKSKSSLFDESEAETKGQSSGL